MAGTRRSAKALLFILLLCAWAWQGNAVTLFIVGDSTAAHKLVDRRPETGWGEALQQWFDLDNVRVENHARNGRSTRTFVSENRWSTVLTRLKRADVVLIQFGHNDASKDRPDRYTPPEEYRKYLVQFIADVRSRHATPVLMTPVMRRRFRAGQFYDSHGEYPDIVRAVAKEQNVTLLDLHRRTEQLIKRHGEEGSKKLFLQLKPGENANYPEGVDDNTHFSPLGAELVAAEVAEAIRESQLPIAKHLRTTRALGMGHGLWERDPATYTLPR